MKQFSIYQPEAPPPTPNARATGSHGRVFWLAVDQRAAEAGMAAAAHLVFEGEDHRAIGRVDDVLEAELMIANVLGDEVSFL
jgi:hypothetical protein